MKVRPTTDSLLPVTINMKCLATHIWHPSAHILWYVQISTSKIIVYKCKAILGPARCTLCECMALLVKYKKPYLWACGLHFVCSVEVIVITEGKIGYTECYSNILCLFQCRGDWCLWGGSRNSGPAPCSPQSANWNEMEGSNDFMT